VTMDVGVARRRLEELRSRRLAEDERLVCLERALILDRARARYANLPSVERQAAVLRDLCEQITPTIEPEDVLLGCMPEVLPTTEQEEFIAGHPELFVEPGVPGVLDSLSIYIPDWDWLLERGLGGLIEDVRRQLGGAGAAEERAFLRAAMAAIEALSGLFRRYADAARHEAAMTACGVRQGELVDAATRCDRVSAQPPATFVEALQLLQVTHMALSCLVGGRDVTPGRLDQYLWLFYRDDVAEGRLSHEEAVVLLAQFMLRLSQMAGNGSDFDDNQRRSPCLYSHLYVTVGGTDERGRPAVNALTSVIVDAIDLLDYKEPTLLVRWRADMDPSLRRRVAELVSRRRPVTIYNDELVVRALESQGVPPEWARGFAHSACHNVLVPGHEAASGPAGFYNVPRLLLDTMADGEVAGFEGFVEAFRRRVRDALVRARADAEARWSTQLEPACPLLQSALMRESIIARRPCWQAASISHFNHYFMGLATVVDSLIAIRRLVFEQRRMSLGDLRELLARNWEGHEALRAEIRQHFPRYGQDCSETRALTSAVGRMWVEEVERASQGLSRAAMWPGFYSHMVHLHEGRRTGATPDGRAAGDPLSESLSPSIGTPTCSPTALLRTMAVLPFDHTPSGAASLSLPAGRGTASDPDRIRELIDTYFALGGLHLHLNVLTAETLLEALEAPERHADLLVRVAGFSALFVRLHPDVQQDIVRRFRGGD